MRSAIKQRQRLVACALVIVLASPALGQQAPQEERKRKTRVCAIEDETRVQGEEGDRSERVLKPGYCVDCFAGIGCGAPFLAAGLLGLLGGTTGVAVGAGAVAVGGIVGGLAGAGAFDHGSSGGGNPGLGPPPGVPNPPGLPGPNPPPVPLPVPTRRPVSPFR